MTSKITVHSPAKINLYLDVTKKRDDGFHELCTVMQEIDLCDSINVTISEGVAISVFAGDHGHIANEKNIAYKAASMYKELFVSKGGNDFSVDISIEKNIPMGGGLGGGSSNAAYVLKALNSLCDNALSKKELLSICAELGSDVAFFIDGKTALCLGRGEIIAETLNAPSTYYVLFNPGIEIPTPSIYKNLKLNKEQTQKQDIETFKKDLSSGKISLYNFLETSVFELYPLEEEIKKQFMAVGAKGSIVSGSGATVLGVAASKEDADRIKEEMDKLFEGKSWVVKTYS